MDMEEIRDLEIIRELLETRQYTNLRQKVAEMNTADVAAILEEIDDEDERSRTARLLTSESGAGEQELRMVADCLRVLEKKRRENEINALKEKMSTQQGEEKRGTLMRIQELLAQENRTGRRE